MLHFLLVTLFGLTLTFDWYDLILAWHLDYTLTSLSLGPRLLLVPSQ